MIELLLFLGTPPYSKQNSTVSQICFGNKVEINPLSEIGIVTLSVDSAWRASQYLVRGSPVRKPFQSFGIDALESQRV